MLRSSRRTGIDTLLFASVSIALLGFAMPAMAHVSGQAPVSPSTFTPQRMVASTASMVALISAIAGAMAVVRAVGRIGPGHGRRGALVALVLGPIGLLTGALVVITANGGLGTGNGIAGGFVAIVVGLVGTTLGWLALTRSRRVA